MPGLSPAYFLKDEKMRAKSLKTLHNKAMNLVQKAIVMEKKLAALRRAAFLLESQAAMTLIDKKDAEPTRSVLFRSAAWLAHNCGEFNKGVRLADLGMDGENVSAEIFEELREVRRECINNFPKK